MVFQLLLILLTFYVTIVIHFNSLYIYVNIKKYNFIYYKYYFTSIHVFPSKNDIFSCIFVFMSEIIFFLP